MGLRAYHSTPTVRFRRALAGAAFIAAAGLTLAACGTSAPPTGSAPAGGTAVEAASNASDAVSVQPSRAVGDNVKTAACASWTPDDPRTVLTGVGDDNTIALYPVNSSKPECDLSTQDQFKFDVNLVQPFGSYDPATGQDLVPGEETPSTTVDNLAIPWNTLNIRSNAWIPNSVPSMSIRNGNTITWNGGKPTQTVDGGRNTPGTYPEAGGNAYCIIKTGSYTKLVPTNDPSYHYGVDGLGHGGFINAIVDGKLVPRAFGWVWDGKTTWLLKRDATGDGCGLEEVGASFSNSRDGFITLSNFPAAQPLLVTESAGKINLIVARGLTAHTAALASVAVTMSAIPAGGQMTQLGDLDHMGTQLGTMPMGVYMPILSIAAWGGFAG